jgi:hypothetical protein
MQFENESDIAVVCGVRLDDIENMVTVVKFAPISCCKPELKPLLVCQQPCLFSEVGQCRSVSLDAEFDRTTSKIPVQPLESRRSLVPNRSYNHCRPPSHHLTCWLGDVVPTTTALPPFNWSTPKTRKAAIKIMIVSLACMKLEDRIYWRAYATVVNTLLIGRYL